MKMRPLFSLLVLLAAAGLANSPLWAADEEGVALAIVYDTSGSMKDAPASSPRSGPKYEIANRALVTVARQIEAFATNKSAGGVRTIHTALYIFQRDRPKEAIKLGPFDYEALAHFAQTFSRPAGNTPLGSSLEVAAKALLESPLPRKHVLFITDGLNTIGPKPEIVLARLKQQAAGRPPAISAHFVAFDIDASQFAPLKKLGATVVSAANEVQLNTQLQFILQRKILLEDEEPPQKK